MFIDLIAALLILYGFYIGYSRGIIKTVFAVFSILIGVLAAVKLSPFTIALLEKIINIHPGLTFVLGFALTFIVILIVIRFIGKKLEDILKFAQINFLNKILGGGIMAILLIVFYSYALWGIDTLQLLSDNNKDSSVSYGYLEALPSKTDETIAKFRPYFEEFWNKMIDTFDQIKEYEKPEKES
ncbi:MAG TPA: CvpA family protein [Bacteroidetes bacterium]|nr:CvpA family protein [Bacteroidota bacterium]